MTFYIYDDSPAGGGRIARTVQQSEWTPEDRALMLARTQHYGSLCPGCGHPKDHAWHPDNEGWFEVVQTRECHACTTLARASDPDAKPAEFHTVADTRDYASNPLPPLALPGQLTSDQLEAAMGGAQ